MSRVLFIRDGALADDLEHLCDQTGKLQFVGVDDLESACSQLVASRFDSLLMPYGDQVACGHPELERIVGDHPDVSVICVVCDGDHGAAARVVQHASADVLLESQLASEHGASMLEALVERLATQSREVSLQHELERRNSELLGLNALASAVSSSLSRDVIVRRALWVFGGLCRKGAVALVQIDPPPPLAERVGEATERLRDEPTDISLKCLSEFAVDGEPVCAAFEPPERWLEIIQDDAIVVFDDGLDPGKLPGIEPLVDRLGDGVLTLVPIWGQGRALGILILADLAPGSRVPFTREGLRAMAAQLGGALENARLFEEVTSAYRSLQSTQDQLVHAEKFAAMGVLAAEIAHEINNPASFVISNLSVMDDYVETIGEFLEDFRAVLEREAPALVDAWEELAERHEIAFLREDLDTLLSRSLGGMQRIHQIVQDLRFFSHDTANEPGWIDIESLLESTINLVKHEAKYRARVELDFSGVPQIFSDANRLSQVFLNLLVNAAHAIQSGAPDENEIVVETQRDHDSVTVTVHDTGEGIPEEILPHIFDPFFTTKEPGEGTGLGLSISRDIVRSLGGQIWVTSTLGQGTTFRVTLPIRAPKFEEDDELRDSGSFTVPVNPNDTAEYAADADTTLEADTEGEQIGKER
ncbi:sensor histidine kinase [Persicimonas caeni]|nr:ATP-binding protein [Persicimonas caeni]